MFFQPPTSPTVVEPLYDADLLFKHLKEKREAAKAKYVKKKLRMRLRNGVKTECENQYEVETECENQHGDTGIYKCKL